MIILYNGQNIEMSDEFSFRDFTRHHILIDIPNGTNVYASCFSKEQPDFNKLFRTNMQNVTFYNCNLDNVFIPPSTNQMVGGSNRRFAAKNDLNDWLLDAANKPTMPIDWKIYQKFGLPIPLPANIPAQKAHERVDLMAIAKGGV